jgi:hypothetical protein
MTKASGHGAWPGGERDVLESQQTVLGDLAELPSGVEPVPFLTQLTQRGPGADAVGRTAALLAESPVELGPHGWKLADRPGMDQRRADALRVLTDCFGADAASPADYFETNWPAEPWARGGPVGIAGPGVYTALGPALRRPVGRIHWAGTETSTYWNGYMDGAVRSGERAAREVLDAL